MNYEVEMQHYFACGDSADCDRCHSYMAERNRREDARAAADAEALEVGQLVLKMVRAGRTLEIVPKDGVCTVSDDDVCPHVYTDKDLLKALRAVAE